MANRWSDIVLRLGHVSALRVVAWLGYPVNDPSEPAPIETFDEALRVDLFNPASEPTLTNLAEIRVAIQGFKVGKAPCPNGVLIRALKHLPQLALSLLAEIATQSCAFITSHHMGTLQPDLRLEMRERRGATVIPSSISMLDTIRMLYENTLLARILSEVRGRGPLRDKQFGFRPKHSTSLLFACLVQSVTRNFGDNRLTVVLFLCVAKKFDTV
jgi:hypothetical protein